MTVLRLTQARTCRPGDAGCQRGAGWNGLSGRQYARTAGVGYRFEPVEVEQLRLVQTSLQRMVDHNVIVQRTAYAYLNALKKPTERMRRLMVGKVNPGKPALGGTY
ncbi:hypothetical protein [Amycolatopsis sp. VC5-11]|uniref:hypothetical protein n=1 Tax=Amycolatopsis sp. VC5-11 TaxID=3120156 RepID=UPI00300B6254